MFWRRILICTGPALFTPIGDNDAKFTGTFNGVGYVISNLKIDSDSNYTGLFGYCGETVKDLTLQDAAVSARQRTGALIGQNGGDIQNCTILENGNHTVPYGKFTKIQRFESIHRCSNTIVDAGYPYPLCTYFEAIRPIRLGWALRSQNDLMIGIGEKKLYW